MGENSPVTLGINSDQAVSSKINNVCRFDGSVNEMKRIYEANKMVNDLFYIF